MIKDTVISQETQTPWFLNFLNTMQIYRKQEESFQNLSIQNMLTPKEHNLRLPPDLNA